MKERRLTLTKYYRVHPKKDLIIKEPNNMETRVGLKSTQLGPMPRVSVYVDLK